MHARGGTDSLPFPPLFPSEPAACLLPAQPCPSRPHAPTSQPRATGSEQVRRSPGPVTRPRRRGLRGPGHLSPPMELRPWLFWVVAAAGALVLLVADARGEKVFTNTWAVHIPGGPAVADRVARKHGFLNLGQVGVAPSGWPRCRTSAGGGALGGSCSCTWHGREPRLVLPLGF